MNSPNPFAAKAGPMQPDEIREVLKQALLDRAPTAHAELKRSGQLAQFLNRLTEMAAETINEAWDRIPVETRGMTDPLLIAQTGNRIVAQANETALALAIEEIDALAGTPADEPQDGEPSLYELTGR